MTIYQVVYGDEETGIVCHCDETYGVFIDGEPQGYANTYEQACELFEELYHQMFYCEEPGNYLDELDEVFQIQNELKYGD